MSALPPETLEERRRKSNRLALMILAGAGGCGCLWFVFAFVGGMVMGVMNARRQAIPPPALYAPSDTDSRSP